MFDKDQYKLALLFEDITSLAPDFGDGNVDRGRFNYSDVNDNERDIEEIDKQIIEKAKKVLNNLILHIKNTSDENNDGNLEINVNEVLQQIEMYKNMYGTNMIKSLYYLLNDDDYVGYDIYKSTIFNTLKNYLENNNEDNETKLPTFDELRSSYLNNPGKIALDKHKAKLKISPKRGEIALQRKKAIDMLNSYFVKELKTGTESMEFTKEIQDEKQKGNLSTIHQQLNFIKNSPAKYNDQQRRGASQLIDRIRWFM